MVVVARPNFTGTWIAERSENFSKFLEAVGVPWVKRKAAAGNQHSQANCIREEHGHAYALLTRTRACAALKFTSTITQDNDNFLIVNKSGPKTTKLDFVTGSTFTQKNWEGEVLETTAEWDGEVLVVVTADNKKKKGSVTVRRYLQGEHLVMVNKRLQLPTVGQTRTLTCGADFGAAQEMTIKDVVCKRFLKRKVDKKKKKKEEKEAQQQKDKK